MKDEATRRIVLYHSIGGLSRLTGKSPVIQSRDICSRAPIELRFSF